MIYMIDPKLMVYKIKIHSVKELRNLSSRNIRLILRSQYGISVDYTYNILMELRREIMNGCVIDDRCSTADCDVWNVDMGLDNYNPYLILSSTDSSIWINNSSRDTNNYGDIVIL